MAHAVKRDDSSGSMGVHLVRFPTPPCTKTKVGPRPSHSIAICVPSFEAIRTIPFVAVARGAASGPRGGTEELEQTMALQVATRNSSTPTLVLAEQGSVVRAWSRFGHLDSA